MNPSQPQHMTNPQPLSAVHYQPTAVKYRNQLPTWEPRWFPSQPCTMVPDPGTIPINNTRRST
eukprot:CAMPEP_0118945498 /NCGR_PEP_ID=MMETSP1169-20130426/42387_1 /TAXON_ID=36882 /ORGANISM="Pyramimonas obovata, Strain CCMP722" /LENGTH=62 /DNA_ID=CAMNT_0006891227 /DNA_START=11 /DNA_END=195 /DNA_ORIENTATION=-